MGVFLRLGRYVRPRRRRGLLVAGVVVALAMAGAAFAWEGLSSASLVSATFYANAVASSQSQTCWG